MNPEPPPPAGDERRRFRTMNAVLFAGVLLTCGGSAWRTQCDVSRFITFGNSLGAVKLSLPSQAHFVLSYHPQALAILLLVAGICGFLTCRRGDRQGTVIVNVSGIVLALGWGALQTSALYLAAMSLLEGMPRRG